MSKNFVVTGANRGIGAAITQGLLANKDFEVFMVCRDSESAETFKANLSKGDVSRCHILISDLGSKKGVTQAISTLSNLDKIDVLVHNAGIWPQKKMINCDGFEQSYMTNHLAPFMINLGLEKKMQDCQGKIIQITAGLYGIGDRDYAATAKGDNFSSIKTYASTKLLNLATTMKFAEKWQGTSITINAVHPGVVRTDLGRRGGLSGAFLNLVKKLWLSPEEGAKAPLKLCSDANQNESGLFYDRFQVKELAPFLKDRNFIDGIWSQTFEHAKDALET